MSKRSLSLLALLAACAAPPSSDTGDPVVSSLDGLGPKVELGIDGMYVDDGQSGIELSTLAWGREGSEQVQPMGAPRDGGCFPDAPGLRRLGCRPAVERPLLGGVERWARQGSALQQGWTLEQAPDGDGPLVVEVQVDGAELALAGDRVLLTTPAGNTWTYAGLRAWDSIGRPLRAWMTVADDLIRVHVDDDGATWPVHVDPVLSTASTTLSESSTDYGIGVSLGGDVNHDGYADVLVGARFGTALYGEAFSYHGSSSGVNTTYKRKYTSSGYYGKFGEYVSNTGDINGDGYDDAIICQFYDEEFFVYYGASSGLASTSGTTVTGVYGLGRDLQIIGDWNADGYDDVVAGSQEPDVNFYRGASSGLVSTAVSTVALSSSPSVSGAGDVNNDGYDDVVYGDATANRVYVVKGASTFPGATTTLSRTGSSELGFSVSGRGDVNGDGYDDVITGDPTYSSSTGRVVVFYGASSGVSTSNYAVLSSPTTGSGFGYTVKMVGDVNGDGYDDVAVSDDYDHSYTYIFHGSSSGLVSTPVNSLNIGDANFGYSIGGGGDVNGDGYDDVLIGTIGSTAYIYEGCQDSDGDGYCGSEDCDDTDAAISPAATESCDSVDNDCDGLIDDADTGVTGKSTWYRDADSDSYGVSTTTTTACSKPSGYVSVSGDCNDASSSINPGATETVGDGVDQTCDGKETCYADTDNDNYRTTSTVTSTDSDCSDSGEALSTDSTGDCDDATYAVNPGATEVCDSVDNDCDGYIDDADSSVSAASKTTWYRDADSDSYGTSSSTTTACSKPSGYATTSTDCDDTSASINPGATETTGDGIDQTCDGRETCYADTDNDSYRTTSTVTSTDSDCNDSGEALSTDSSGDCNDSSSSINPGATETTGDGTDQNCDGLETCYADVDNDSYRTTSTVSSTDSDCNDSGEALSTDSTGDCDDATYAVNPGASEVCDGVDNDCDGYTDDADPSVAAGSVTTYYLDSDSDSYGTSSSTITACSKPSGYATTSTDCDDSSSSINPGATETTGDGIDQNCDGRETCYADTDNDSYRTTSTVTSTDSDCTDSGEALSTDSSGDCDDADDGINPAASEVCDGVDNDCDGYTDSADSSVDSGTLSTYYLDADADGYGSPTSSTTSCDLPTGYASNATDCDDGDAGINPGVSETVGDGVDGDCDGSESCYVDGDIDGYRTDETTISDDGDCDDDGEALSSEPGEDCDDGDDTIYPDAPDPAYDGIDQNCDGLDSVDLDGDGYEAAEAGGDDCDDTDASVYPGAPETWYDGIDGDCLGGDDYDADLDGYDSDLYGGDDCDDADASTYPDATDAWYDGVDSDCAGNSDYDADLDGHDSDAYSGDDCDDEDATVYTGAPELSDGLDNDCDGHDELYDGDGDGLTDLDEADLGTDPEDPDTDGDTLTDGEEVHDDGTDPLSADSDGGGVDDGDEVGRGSNPLDASDDAFPLDYVKGGCACSTDPAPVHGAAWLGLLVPLALIRRRSR